MSKVAFIFKTDGARRKYLDGIRELFGKVLVKADRDIIVTLSGDVGYLVLENQLEVQMRGRSIDEYYFMEGSPGSNVDIDILKVAVTANKG